jgi:hypothetical protein
MTHAACCTPRAVLGRLLHTLLCTATLPHVCVRDLHLSVCARYLRGDSCLMSLRYTTRGLVTYARASQDAKMMPVKSVRNSVEMCLQVNLSCHVTMSGDGESHECSCPQGRGKPTLTIQHTSTLARQQGDT